MILNQKKIKHSIFSFDPQETSLIDKEGKKVDFFHTKARKLHALQIKISIIKLTLNVYKMSTYLHNIFNFQY